MKKFLSLIVVLMFAFGVKAQFVSITEAVDFTFSDEGSERTLFEVLDSGQHALLYFFNYQSTEDVTIAIINEMYNELGKNQNDVYTIGLDPANESVLLNQWAYLNEVEFPLVAKDKAYYISQTYSGSSFGLMLPTLVLIAPNHDVILKEIWPISSAEQVVGIINDNLVTGDDNTGDDDGNDEDDEGDEPEYPEQTTVPEAPVINVYAENSGLIVIEWEAVETAIFYYVYYNGNLVGDGQVMGTEVEILVNPETTYCFTVTAVNTVGESEHSNEACATTPSEEGEEPENPDSTIELDENGFVIYPNPVNDRLYIEAETEIKEVVVYDVYGRHQVAETPSHQGNVTVDVADMKSGIYFVKVVTEKGETVQRFVKK